VIRSQRQERITAHLVVDRSDGHDWATVATQVPSIRSRPSNEDSTKQTLFPASDQVGPIGQPLLPLVTHDFPELALVTEKLRLPGTRDHKERLRYVGHLDISKAGPGHQNIERTSGCYRSRSETNRGPMC
jgi:hypothetical protein